MLTPEEVNLFWRVSQRAGEFKIKDKHQRGGGKRNFSGHIKACTKILRQGKAGFKNKQTSSSTTKTEYNGRQRKAGKVMPETGK